MIGAMITQSIHELTKWSSDHALWEHAAFVTPRDSTSYYNLGVHLLTHRGQDMAHNHRHGHGHRQGQRAGEGVTLAEEGEEGVTLARAEEGEEGVTLAEAMFEESILLEPKYGAAW